MMLQYFSEVFEVSLNYGGGPDFLGGGGGRTNSPERLNYLAPPFCISILEIWRTQILRNLLDLNACYTWFSITFLRFLKFRQIKKGGRNFLGRTNSAELLNYLVPLVLFSGFTNFLKLKRGGLNFLGEPILQNSWIFAPLLYFNFRNLKDPNSS